MTLVQEDMVCPVTQLSPFCELTYFQEELAVWVLDTFTSTSVAPVSEPQRDASSVAAHQDVIWEHLAQEWCPGNRQM